MNKTTKGLVSVATTMTLAATFATTDVEAAYKVKSGDTLSKIAQKYNTSVSSLQAKNGISGHLIYPGQTIQTSGKVKSSSVSSSNSGSSVVNVAKRYVGTPYVWGGSTPGGFDCSGFIAYSFKQAGKNIGRTTVANYYSQAAKIGSPRVGDLVFFSGTTSRGGMTHMGIYAGNNTFVHAASNGVEVSSLSNSYWSSHFAGYGRL